MKKLPFYVALFSIALISALPHSSFAYSTSEQTAVRLSDSHVLFTITYDIGFLNRAAYAPLVANTGTIANEVSYSIIASNGNKMYVPSAGFVTAKNAVLENNYYRLQMGKKSDFTLSVIAAIPKSDVEHSLKITKLPFILIDKDNTTRLSEFEPSTISDYQTPVVK
jgi:hypothetical protein